MMIYFWYSIEDLYNLVFLIEKKEGINGGLVKCL